MSSVMFRRALARHGALILPVGLLAAACKSDSRDPTELKNDSTAAIRIALNPATVTIHDTIGRAGPAPLSVNIANSGTGALSGIALGTITYGGGASGWLTAALSGDTSPATVTLTSSDSGLAAGMYTATVPVTASTASNSPQNLSVTLRLAERPRPQPIAGVTILAAGQMGECGGGLNRATADVVAAARPDYLILLGDIVDVDSTRDVATLEDFQRCYDPVWGRFKDITYVALGGDEVDRDPDSPTAGMALGADAYFGPDRVGPPGQNWFSFDVGSWHVIILNIQGGGPTALPRNIHYNAGSEQLRWLARDLSANRSKRCTIAFFHQPMWISSNSPPTPTDPAPNHGYRQQSIRGVWTVLYERNADVVVNGGRSIYQRFAPMRYAEGYQNPTPSEFAADSARGIRQFTSGLAGDGPLQTPTFAIVHPLSELLSGGNGILKLTLGDGEYTWEFLNTKYSNVKDWGSGKCH